MANKNIEQFITTYGPVAQQVSKEINVDPNVLLGQWGLESRWGQTEMAKKHHNLGGIKDFSGAGLEAKDNKTGSLDKYVKFEDPEVFGMYYADQIKRNFPLAVNTGPDVGAFTRGLASGKNGSYFGVPVEEYESSLASAQASIPENRTLPFEAGKGTTTPAVLAEETDEQREARMQADMDAQEKRQAQLIGAGTGVGISGTKAVGAGAGAVLQGAANRVGQGFRAGMQGGTTQVPTAPLVQGGLSALDPNANQATRILQGTTGDEGTTGRARQQGYNEQTSQQAAQRKEMDKLLSQLRQTGAVADDAPAFFARNPGMTSSPSGVLYPRSEPAQTLGPRGPQGQVGFTRPPPPAPLPPPASPSMYSRAAGGLDWITGKFADMFRPVSSAVSTVAKYGLPPIALASAAGEGVNIAQQYRKPEDQRDITSMMLSGGNILGSGLSMFPPTAPVGIPLAIGTGAAQAYRDNPDFQEYVKRKMQGLANAPLLDEMTGPLP